MVVRTVVCVVAGVGLGPPLLLWPVMVIAVELDRVLAR
jgi:hypothetical protein